MPCDQRRTITVDAGKMNADQLVAALKALGLAPWIDGFNRIHFSGGNYNTQTGKMEIVERYGETKISLNQVKQAYSAEIVKSQAKKYNWQLKEVAPFQYHVTKR